MTSAAQYCFFRKNGFVQFSARNRFFYTGHTAQDAATPPGGNCNIIPFFTYTSLISKRIKKPPSSPFHTETGPPTAAFLCHKKVYYMQAEHTGFSQRNSCQQKISVYNKS